MPSEFLQPLEGEFGFATCIVDGRRQSIITIATRKACENQMRSTGASLESWLAPLSYSEALALQKAVRTLDPATPLSRDALVTLLQNCGKSFCGGASSSTMQNDE